MKNYLVDISQHRVSKHSTSFASSGKFGENMHLLLYFLSK